MHHIRSVKYRRFAVSVYTQNRQLLAQNFELHVQTNCAPDDVAVHCLVSHDLEERRLRLRLLLAVCVRGDVKDGGRKVASGGHDHRPSGPCCCRCRCCGPAGCLSCRPCRPTNKTGGDGTRTRALSERAHCAEPQLH